MNQRLLIFCYRDELENLKIIPYTSANLNILQPAGVAGLSRDSVKILVSIFGPYCSNLNFTTALEYNIDDVKYYVPLPLLLLHSVINTRQQLEVLSNFQIFKKSKNLNLTT